MRLPRAGLVLVVFAALLFAAPAAHASTFTPNKVADSADGVCDSDCSLREAVMAANANPGADTISLNNGAFALSITTPDFNDVKFGDLDITDDLTINGPGVITGPQELGSRLIEVADGKTVAINDVTVSGGGDDDGGAIRNGNGTLTLTNVWVTGATTTSASFHAGAISNYGSLTIDHSTVSGNHSGPGEMGGGLYSEGLGPVNITNSTFSGNSADNGGGIWATGNFPSVAVNITSSTITDNSALGFGGGIYATNVTLTMKSSVLADNHANNFGDDCDSNFVSAGYNVVGDSTACNNPEFTPQTGDVVNVDAKLAPLGANGGRGPTHPPYKTSPARERVSHLDATCAGTDERGVARPEGTDCESGAYEGFINDYIPDAQIQADPDDGLQGNNVYSTDGSNETVQLKAKRKKTVQFPLAFQNDGDAADTFTITGCSSPAKGFTVTYTDASQNDHTSEVTGAGWITDSINPVDTRYLYLNVKVGKKGPKTFSCAIQVASSGDSSLDVVVANIKVKS